MVKYSPIPDEAWQEMQRKAKVILAQSGRFLEVACVLECKPVQSETCKQ